MSYHAPSNTWRAKLPPALPYEPRETYHPTREVAEAWISGELARYAASLIEAAPSPPLWSGMTLGDWLDRWFAMTAPSADWAERTRRIYREHLWQWSPVHDVPLADLTPSRLQQVVADLIEHGAVRRPESTSKQPVTPLAPSSVREAVATLRRALERARDDGLLARNPAARLVVPKAVRASPIPWTADERRKLAPLVGGDELEALWRLLFECGLRIGEALGLLWADAVDLDARVITIRRVVFSDGRVQEWPKSRRPRTVDLTTRAAAALRARRDRMPEAAWVFEHERPDRRQRSWVYRGTTYARLWSYDGIRYRLQRLAERAGVDYHPSHSGRHSHATKLLLDGVPAADVAARLGHADASVTLRLYASPSEEGRRRALAAAETSLDD